MSAVIKMVSKKILICVIILSVNLSCESANILYAIPFTAPSHYIFLRPVGLELAARGHNVTVLTPRLEPNPPPNYHQLLLNNTPLLELLDIEKPNVFDLNDLSAEALHETLLFKGGPAYTESTLNSGAVTDFLNNNNKFDLVIVELFFHEAYYALANKYNAPLVLITAYGNCMRHNFVFRNPLQLATVIPEFVTLRNPTSFRDRLRSLTFTIYEYIRWIIYLNEQELIAQRYITGLASSRPSLYDMQQNASLILYNAHYSFDVPTAYLPNIVEVGGLHLNYKSKKMPEDLQRILDTAKNGIVYMNFGSNVQSSELSEDKKQAFLKAFKKLKQTVLWKWEQDDLEGKSENVFIRKWMPQKEILSHPNIKLFITHGGLMSSQEALFFGVPVVGVPVFADQYNNLLIAQDKGYGRILEYHDITEESISKILNDVLKDDSYRIKAKEFSKLFKDRPMTALDTAMYWIEYVLRHKGAAFIRNPALKLSWIEFAMLDVYAFIFVIFIIVLFFLFGILKLVLSFCKFNERKVSKKDD